MIDYLAAAKVESMCMDGWLGIEKKTNWQVVWRRRPPLERRAGGEVLCIEGPRGVEGWWKILE